jgi:hypothetical protein
VNNTYLRDIPPGLNRLVAVALVDRRFCQLLLSCPQIAVEQEYNLESFRLTLEEKKIITSITANSLNDFTRQIRLHIDSVNKLTSGQ